MFLCSIPHIQEVLACTIVVFTGAVLSTFAPNYFWIMTFSTVVGLGMGGVAQWYETFFINIINCSCDLQIKKTLSGNKYVNYHLERTGLYFKSGSTVLNRQLLQMQHSNSYRGCMKFSDFNTQNGIQFCTLCLVNTPTSLRYIN